MTRIAALSSVLSEPVSRTLIRKALSEQIRPPVAQDIPAAGEPPSVATIQAAVCSVLEVTRDDVLSTKRTAKVARARQVAMFLARDLTSLSLADIAREFNRDHTTILHAVRSVDGRRQADEDVDTAIHRSYELLGMPRSRNPIAPHPATAGAPSPSTAKPPTTKP